MSSRRKKEEIVCWKHVLRGRYTSISFINVEKEQKNLSRPFVLGFYLIVRPSESSFRVPKQAIPSIWMFFLDSIPSLWSLFKIFGASSSWERYRHSHPNIFHENKTNKWRQEQEKSMWIKQVLIHVIGIYASIKSLKSLSTMLFLSSYCSLTLSSRCPHPQDVHLPVKCKDFWRRHTNL